MPLPPTESTLPIRLDIHIRADRTDIINNVDATIYASADFNLVGTLDRPVLRGYVEIESGYVQFGANRLIVQPSRIDVENNQPIFDIEAVTRPRFGGQTYDITVRIRGTFDKLEPTMTSDPWLPQMQIVSVLLGNVPTDAERLSEVQARLAPQDAQKQRAVSGRRRDDHEPADVDHRHGRQEDAAGRRRHRAAHAAAGRRKPVSGSTRASG